MLLSWHLNVLSGLYEFLSRWVDQATPVPIQKLFPVNPFLTYGRGTPPSATDGQDIVSPEDRAKYQI